MLIIPGMLESYRSLKDKTLKVTFETMEPSGEQLIQIAGSTGKFGYLAFKEDPYKENEKKVLGDLSSGEDLNAPGKSKAQRLRAVLYRNWEINDLGYEVFDDYYNYKMEKIIMHYKSQLP